MSTGAPLAIEAIEVLEDRVVARVRCDEARMRTRDWPGTVERAFACLPGMLRHRCDNGEERAVREEFADTEIPHVLEHVAVELLRLGAPSPANRGETSWDFANDGRGVFRVALLHPDDLACLASLKGAAALVAEWAAGGPGDSEAAVAAVWEARER